MALLSLDRVSFSYWRGARELKVLNGVSLEVDVGDLVAVYGKATAGKTTLLKVSAGLLRPDRGSVTFEGANLSTCSRQELARVHREDVGWVDRAGPKSDELPTVVYVALALYRRHGARDAQRQAVTALERVGAAECAFERWSDLSDTDRVLVAIAQALVHRPKLVVIDDPTYGFALADRERVLTLLRGVAEDDGMGVLMAVPDMPAMVPAHRVRLIHRGRLIAPTDLASADARNVVRFPHTEQGA